MCALANNMYLVCMIMMTVATPRKSVPENWNLGNTTRRHNLWLGEIANWPSLLAGNRPKSHRIASNWIEQNWRRRFLPRTTFNSRRSTFDTHIAWPIGYISLSTGWASCTSRLHVVFYVTHKHKHIISCCGSNRLTTHFSSLRTYLQRNTNK